VLLDVVAVLRGGDRKGSAVHRSLCPVFRRAEAPPASLPILEVVIRVVGVARGKGEGAVLALALLLAWEKERMVGEN
jgi:hypothetical protein